VQKPSFKLHQRASVAAFDELPEYDEVRFSGSVRFGKMVAQIRNGSVSGTSGSIFPSTAMLHGGQESTIPTLFHLSTFGLLCPFRGQIHLDVVLARSPYGATTIERWQPASLHRRTGHTSIQGKHVASIDGGALEGSGGRSLRTLRNGPMIKDIMVYVDGSAADEMRLAAVDDVTRLFQSQVIALYLNAIPSLAPVNAGAGGLASPLDLVQQAKEEGDMMEAVLAMRLARLERPVEIRRFDILADDVANIGAREARTADTLWRCAPTGSYRSPKGSWRVSFLDQAGISCWFPRGNDPGAISIASSLRGTALGNRRARSQRPCHSCTKPKKSP
jgi:hypothetical protein